MAVEARHRSADRIGAARPALGRLCRPLWPRKTGASFPWIAGVPDRWHLGLFRLGREPPAAALHSQACWRSAGVSRAPVSGSHMRLCICFVAASSCQSRSRMGGGARRSSRRPARSPVPARSMQLISAGKTAFPDSRRLHRLPNVAATAPTASTIRLADKATRRSQVGQAIKARLPPCATAGAGFARRFRLWPHMWFEGIGATGPHRLAVTVSRRSNSWFQLFGASSRSADRDRRRITGVLRGHRRRSERR